MPTPVWSPSPLESTSYISLGSIATYVPASFRPQPCPATSSLVSLLPASIQSSHHNQAWLTLIRHNKYHHISCLKIFLKLPKAHRKRPCPGPGIPGSLGFATTLPHACNTSQLDPSLPIIACLPCLSSGSTPCQGYLFPQLRHFQRHSAFRIATGTKTSSLKSGFLLHRLEKMGSPRMLVAKKPGVWTEIIQADVGLKVLLPLPLSPSYLSSLFWVVIC